MHKPTLILSRRAFLRGTATTMAAFTIAPRHLIAGSPETPPSEKLNLAFVGVGGRGGHNLDMLGGQNVIAVCDVDLARTDAALKKHPQAKRYQDFRTMLDAVEKSIDGVVVSTPDHTHAVVAMAAIQRGKHVYCEKPLAHSIGEVRVLMQAARERKVVTQLGNQGHSSNTIRTFCEWIWNDAIGQVHTIHAVSAALHCTIDQFPQLKEKHPVPAGLDWNTWLGPAKFRPYHPMYLPGKWRAWSPFGCGAIGDWACHVVDPVFWALDLGAPATIQAQAANYDPKKHADTFPAGSVITFEFPAKGKRGPVKLVWFDGKEKPPRPADLEADDTLPATGAIVMGDKGTIVYGSHGAGNLHIIPDAKMAAYRKPKQTIPRIKDHHGDWVQAVREGKPAGSNFDYGGPLTEIALLGIIATRMLGQKLEWDGAAMRFTNSAQANRLVKPSSRRGWKLG